MLLAMNEKAFRAIRPGLKYVRLKSHSILHESNRKTGAVYFPDSGLISLVIVTSNGKTAEAGLVGKEGIAGIEALVGFKRSPLREVVQVAGSAHRISGSNIRAMLHEFPEVLLQFTRFAALNRIQVAQTAACNRLHELEQRLARWLLLTQDRVDDGLIQMTHDFLATMLGTDRGSVTEAAILLQRRGLISYTRGAVKILNRKRLEQSACECYALIQGYNGEVPR
jgi:CRP-like cAMP-binding protein